MKSNPQKTAKALNTISKIYAAACLIFIYTLFVLRIAGNI